MGQYAILIEKLAQQELLAHYKSGNKLAIKRIEQIMLDLSIHPETGIGKPEKLKFSFSRYWSRQITK
jgi:toxin YoeB